MSIQSEVIGTATVDCPTDEDYGGRITLTIFREYHVLPSGADATTIHGERVNQTCTCELSDDDKEDVVEGAQRKLELRHG